MPPPSMVPTPRGFQQRLEACGLAFSRAARVSRATMPQALAAMADEAAALTDAARVTIWLHDRRARELWLAARSGHRPVTPTRIAADETSEPPALGLTLERPVQLPDPARGPHRGPPARLAPGPGHDGAGERVAERAHGRRNPGPRVPCRPAPVADDREHSAARRSRPPASSAARLLRLAGRSGDRHRPAQRGRPDERRRAPADGQW